MPLPFALCIPLALACSALCSAAEPAAEEPAGYEIYYPGIERILEEKDGLIETGRTGESPVPRDKVDMVQLLYTLTRDQARQIASLPALQYCRIERSPEVAEVEPGALTILAGSPKLESLFLAVDHLSLEDAKAISRSQSITWLWVYLADAKTMVTTKFEPDVPEQFLRMKQLEHLSLISTSQLSPAFVRGLSALPHLRSLTLNSLVPDSGAMQTLASLPDLESLYLIHREIPGLTVEAVASLNASKMRVLDLSPWWRKPEAGTMIPSIKTLLSMPRLIRTNFSDLSKHSRTDEERAWFEKLEAHLEKNRQALSPEECSRFGLAPKN